jgi:hypothetical protein
VAAGLGQLRPDQGRLFAGSGQSVPVEGKAEGRQVLMGTPGACKVREKSTRWYGRAPASLRPGNFGDALRLRQCALGLWHNWQ